MNEKNNKCSEWLNNYAIYLSYKTTFPFEPENIDIDISRFDVIIWNCLHIIVQIVQFNSKNKNSLLEWFIVVLRG